MKQQISKRTGQLRDLLKVTVIWCIPAENESKEPGCFLLGDKNNNHSNNNKKTNMHHQQNKPTDNI